MHWKTQHIDYEQWKMTYESHKGSKFPHTLNLGQAERPEGNQVATSFPDPMGFLRNNFFFEKQSFEDISC